MRLANLTSSVSILVLLGAVGLVAFSSSSIADSTAGEQAPRKKPPGAEVPQEALERAQKAMEMFKKMQQSGKMPGGIQLQPTKAKRTSSSRSKKKSPPPKRAVIPSVKPLLKPNVEYAATSYLKSSSGGVRVNVLTIHESPNMARFQTKRGQIYIFRYDKGIVWSVIPEKRRYPGIKLYQEFKLRSGRGLTGYIDRIMEAYGVLKHPKKLKNLGKETINGYVTTHYQKRYRIPWLTNKFSITDYWLSDSGILMKVTNSGPGDAYGQASSSIIEMKDIRLGKQPEHLFVPPPDYKKAGQMIDWAEEKKKRDAAKRK